MTDQIITQIENTIADIQAITSKLVEQSSPAKSDPIKTEAEELTWITPSFKACLEDIKAIEDQMERVNNDVNGNPRYVLHFLAFDSDYATAKEIANSLGWSTYRAKSHGGCFVSQVYSKRFEASAIVKAKARLASA
jgi:hypothetical protein